MQKWEYLTMGKIDMDKTLDELNRLGQEGWELAGTTHDDCGRWAYLILKRPRN